MATGIIPLRASTASLRTKTGLFTIIVILSSTLGNFFLTLGLKHWGGELAFSPLGYIQAIFNPWVLAGVTLLIVWMLSRMALLSWADLSYVLPVTALGYIASTLFGKFMLDEQISTGRWAGTLLIVAGVALVGRTSPQTTETGRESS
jgi:uncharacterized membrane protein